MGLRCSLAPCQLAGGLIVSGSVRVLTNGLAPDRCTLAAFQAELRCSYSRPSGLESKPFPLGGLMGESKLITVTL